MVNGICGRAESIHVFVSYSPLNVYICGFVYIGARKNTAEGVPEQEVMALFREIYYIVYVIEV